jgi:glucosamine--fructose-6-phosphate aminotransferase (isomerizing)
VAELHESSGYLKATLERQPGELSRLLADDSAARAAERLRDASRIFVVGTGTSYHGAMAGQFMLRNAGRDAWAVRAFEFANYPPSFDADDGLILLSHRGSKRFSHDSLEQFQAASDRWLVITGEGSPLEGEGVVRTVEQEKSPVHTASHTAAMLRLAQIACALGSPAWRRELARVPGAVAAAVELRDQVASALSTLELGATLYFVGGGPAHATACEGALKIREAAHTVSAEAHDVEGILHGPLISVLPRQAAILVSQAGASLERTQEVGAAMVEIGTTVFAVGADARAVPSTSAIVTPAIDEVLAPIVNVVPLQWLAYEAAQRLGVDADSFRRDEAPYASAQSKYVL